MDEKELYEANLRDMREADQSRRQADLALTPLERLEQLGALNRSLERLRSAARAT